MEVEINPATSAATENGSPHVREIVEHLLSIPGVQFKSQQRGESELTNNEKRDIAHGLFNRSKFNFLSRFGHLLKQEHLEYFEKYVDTSDIGIELDILIKKLIRYQSKDVLHRLQRNRRYEALKSLIAGNTYFSDTEMMKRNPLLYDQLVGRYLSEEERRLRDKADNQSTFVKILMEGIERDEARDIQKLQEEAEDDAMEEEDTSDEDENVSPDEEPQPTTSKWGEFDDMKDKRINKDEFYPKHNNITITASERALLKDEFITFMHQSFLDGNDEDFDYSTVDDNENYDNIDIVTHDAEDKYFDSEEPEDANMEDNDSKVESSEDELDIYMNALNQHPAVCALSLELKKL